MAVDLEEVEAVAAALTETVGELLNENHNALVDLLNGQDANKLKAIFGAAREALGEVKAHEDQRAWNEDVRAFAVALIRDTGVPRNCGGARLPGSKAADTSEVITAAINMADAVQIIRKTSREAK